ncbi:hypothetical protein [Actinomadura litoris]|uniref:Uncharacterized protein n=1 Tax=Actinomadura litoris TaxID=2678616 RepID=A0A7K1L3L5_9ACTN|nr:hypothetical protein [Actinomadura litoris]MUN38987.1 hypothetical protein [Actinomadura litoris]
MVDLRTWPLAALTASVRGAQDDVELLADDLTNAERRDALVVLVLGVGRAICAYGAELAVSPDELAEMLCDLIADATRAGE